MFVLYFTVYFFLGCFSMLHFLVLVISAIHLLAKRFKHEVWTPSALLFERQKKYITTGYIYIWLSDKRSALCGVGVLTANKICFKHFVLLLHCVCVHNWSISQWKQYEFQIWSCWSNIYFWNWKAPWNLTPENRHNVCSRWVLSMLSFSYMTNQNITSVTDLYRGNIALHSAYKIVCH